MQVSIVHGQSTVCIIRNYTVNVLGKCQQKLTMTGLFPRTFSIAMTQQANTF